MAGSGTKSGTAVAQRLTGFFRIAERGSTPARELIAGLTTFGAMSYIVIVNPAILSAAGMNLHSVIVATAFASMLGTLIMALWANLPIALAPGMGSNVIFAQIVVLKLGISYQTALTMVLIGAILFLILSVTRFREKIVDGFPVSIRIGMQCGIGLLIAYIGLSNAGLLVHQNGQAGFGDLTDPAILLAFIGLLATPILVALRVPAAFLISIVAITAAGLFIHSHGGPATTVLPDSFVELPELPRELLFAFNFNEFFSHFFLVLPITLYFFLSDFFSATATLIGVTRRGGIMNADGHIPNARRAYAADGLASIFGGMLGTSTVVAFVESATGVEAGGRTGLTGVVVAALFGAALFLWPLIACIPPQATAPALVLVGILMMEGIKDLDFSRVEDVIPPMLIMIITVITTDLMIGLASACFVYTAIVAATRQWHKVTRMLLTLDAIFVVYIILAQQVR